MMLQRPSRPLNLQLVRQVGSAGTVLFKNTNAALLLDLQKIKCINVFGSDIGLNLNGPNGCPDRGYDRSTLSTGWAPVLRTFCTS
jgi:beta-glucosidase